MIKRFVFCLIVCLISVSGMAQMHLTFPRLTGQVVDEANILSADTERAILATMTPQQQFVVVTLRSLRGRSIEEYGVALGRHWGIGSAEKNDGLLLIVAPNEREVRIEVGYGLEHIMTDAQSAQIIQNIILPSFRKNQYEQGILNGVYQIQNVLKGKQVSVPRQRSSTGWRLPKWLYFIPFFLIFYISLYGELKNFIRLKGSMQDIMKDIPKEATNGLLLVQNVKDFTPDVFRGKFIFILCLILPIIGLLDNLYFIIGSLFFGFTLLLFFWYILSSKHNRRISGGNYNDYGDSSSSSSSSFSDSGASSGSSDDSFSGGGGSFGGGGSSGRW